MQIIRNMWCAIIIFYLSSLTQAGIYEPKLMINLGATCYANAGLQCLFATKSFPQWLLNQKIPKDSHALCQKALKIYKEYNDIENERNDKKKSIDKLNPSIQNLPPKQKDQEYYKDTEFLKLDKIFQEAIKAKEAIQKEMQEAIRDNKPQFAVAALQQMVQGYQESTIRSISTVCIAEILGKISTQQDTAEQTIALLDEIAKAYPSLPTQFTLAGTKVNAISPLYTELIDLGIWDNPQVTTIIQAALAYTTQAPAILILPLEENLPIPSAINNYRLISTAWRIDDGIEGHYFAVAQISGNWYRLDDPGRYGDKYDIRAPAPRTQMLIRASAFNKIMKGGTLHLDSFNYPKRADLPNSAVRCRMLVYERQDSEAEEKKKHGEAGQALSESLQELNANLRALSTAIS